MSFVEDCYWKSVEVLEKCATPRGFYAAYPGYDMVFARDSMIMSLGASLVGEKFKEVFKKSLVTLGDNQSEKGQIPNAVDSWSSRQKHVDFKSIDSTLWWIIGHYRYKEMYRDASLFKRYKKKIEKALTWLSYQDMGEDGMLEQQPTTDWQDAFPHRYGHTINTQVLYYHVLNLAGKKKDSNFLKKQVNENKDDGLWDEKYYLSYRWKNHGKYQEKSDWFDTQGNMIAITYGLADSGKSKSILDYVKKKGIDKPWPMHGSVWPPIKQGSRYWEDYFLDCDARTPWHYINSGIWTYIGGFYVCALVKAKRFAEAEKQLGKLAEANLKSDFAEWMDGKTGRVHDIAKQGGVQGWNAAMYIVAYESVKQRKCLA